MIKINLLGRTKLKAAKTRKIGTASNQTLMAVMAVADTAKFDIMRQQNRRY